MKKLAAIVLSLAMLLVSVSALADLVICQNKVEITEQMEAYAKLYTEKTGVDVKVITGGGSSDYNTVLKSEMQSGREPDIWVIEGPSGYELWKDKIADQAGAEWTQYTAAAYMDGDKVVGFPVAVEGYGLAYNKNILDKAGIDPATLTNYDAYAAAFEKLDSMKAELGLDMVVSMVAGTTTGMTWVTGLHNFNVYLTVGNKRNDTTIIDKVLAGEVDPERFPVLPVCGADLQVQRSRHAAERHPGQPAGRFRQRQGRFLSSGQLDGSQPGRSEPRLRNRLRAPCFPA